MVYTFPSLSGSAKVYSSTLVTRVFELNLKWGVLSLCISNEPLHEIFLHNSTVSMNKGYVFITCDLYDKIAFKFSNPTQTSMWYAALRASSDWSIESFYTLRKRIGTGSFGLVHEAVHNRTGAKAAIKTIEVREGNKELEMLTAFDHPNVISALDAFRTREWSYIVLPIMEKGDLRRILEGKANNRMCIEEAKSCFRQVLEGLRYLHGRGIVHCDLKPENIMCTIDPVSGHDVYKIIDFGGSVRLSKDGLEDDPAYTRGYVAPELFNSVNFGIAADIWSCGAILYEMLTGKQAVKQTFLESKEVRCKLGKYNRFGFHWFRLARSSKSIIKKLLKVNQDERITIDDALEHPFMK